MIPPEQSSAFVAAMENVLEVYSWPYNEDYPVICMDEKPVQFFADTRKGFRSRRNAAGYYDHEYIKNGNGCIFMFTEPLQGWRYADAQEHRTKIDWAKQIAWLVEDQYPRAKKIVLVMDNLNIHSVASLYDAFEPKRAFEIANRLEIHYTPKHGSWLNIAEIELSALGRQCLESRRIASLELLRKELKFWFVDRNKKQRGIDWHFTTDDARIKLKRLYPIVNF
ncbi:IS630 family transposase [Dehalobacter sp.]|uniref:IS630 family transposase n=1 Tax=Dehalobacter sp. TaxID=1962289 RepID=UPI00258A21CF|nr:IS630 family transposase [Dehalobacter sp.]MDJ0304513.1 IS630 family transposase [Dehalobacter sp.]